MGLHDIAADLVKVLIAGRSIRGCGTGAGKVGF